MIYPVVAARVTAHSPPRSVQVTFKTTGQAIPAQGQGVAVMPLVDYADALRVRQKPLPGLGTWGIVVFPYGDIRNGVWLGSYEPSLQDARTATGDATDPFIDYTAHFSGDWDLLDGKGNYAHQWADGSSLVVAATSGLPKPVRHIVDADNKQQTVEFTRADRIPDPPAPFVLSYVGASGTKLTIAADGSATLDLAAGKQLTITQNGAAATDFLTLVSKLVTFFNSHIHTDPQGGNTGVPVTPMTANDVKSAVIDIND